MGEPKAHEKFEILLMKAVDGFLEKDEWRELKEHLSVCPSCAAELEDFQQLKEATDAMAARIAKDAAIEPPRETREARLLIRASFLLLFLGTFLLLGFAGYQLALDLTVPLVVKLGLGAVALGAVGLGAYAFTVRIRAIGKDPYQEIDQ